MNTRDLPPEPSANRFMMEVEALVRSANRDAIAAKVPKLTRADLEGLIRTTAELRAEYLAAAFATDWHGAETDATELGIRRRRFEEAVAAFEALERAVRRHYIDISP